MDGKTYFYLISSRKNKSASIYFLLTTLFILFVFSSFAKSNSLLAKNEENTSPFIVRKPETLETLRKLAENENSYHFFIYDNKSKNIIPLEKATGNDNHQKFISFRTNKLKDIEIKLFEDGKKGVWNHFSLIDAALIAEGITDDASRRSFLEQYEKICLDLKRRIVRYKDPKIKTRFVFEYMHRIILKGKYNLNLSVISEVFNSGNYNCVSATVLFNSLAREVGLNVIGLETTGHAKSRVLYEDEFLDIETTCPRWSLLPDKLTNLALRNVIPEPDETLLKISPLSAKNVRKDKINQSKTVSSVRGEKSTGDTSETIPLPTVKKTAVPKKHLEQTAVTKTAPAISVKTIAQKNAPNKTSEEISAHKKTSVNVQPAVNAKQSPESLKDSSQNENSDNKHFVSQSPQNSEKTNGKSVVASRPITETPSRDLNQDISQNGSQSDQSKNASAPTSQNKKNYELSKDLLAWSGNRVMREITYGQLIAAIYYNSGVDHYQDQNCAMALSCYLKALQLDPNNETIWSNFKATLNNWAIQLAKSNKFPEAIRMVEIGMEIDPKFEQFQLNLPIFFLNWIAKLEGEHRQKEADDLKKIFKSRFPDYKEESLKEVKTPAFLPVKKSS